MATEYQWRVGYAEDRTKINVSVVVPVLTAWQATRDAVWRVQYSKPDQIGKAMEELMTAVRSMEEAVNTVISEGFSSVKSEMPPELVQEMKRMLERAVAEWDTEPFDDRGNLMDEPEWVTEAKTVLERV